MPNRIQRKRTKGWKTPLCSCGCGKPARYVGRPTFWGNMFQPLHLDGEWWVQDDNDVRYPLIYNTRNEALRKCVGLYHCELTQWSEMHMRLPELRGHDLACWCPLDMPCHADYLIAAANA